MIQEWLKSLNLATLFIEPGSPWKNGYAESFHSLLRDEFLAIRSSIPWGLPKRSLEPGRKTSITAVHTAVWPIGPQRPSQPRVQPTSPVTQLLPP
jgi:transposase InsO family protein